MGNIGIAAPAFTGDLDEERVIEFFQGTEPSLAALAANLGLFPSGEDFLVKICGFGKEGKSDILASRAVVQILLSNTGTASPLEFEAEDGRSTIRPPEVIMFSMSGGAEGREWDDKSDIWAVGCLVSRWQECLVETVLKLVGTQVLSFHLLNSKKLYATLDPAEEFYRALRLGGSPSWDEVSFPLWTRLTEESKVSMREKFGKASEWGEFKRTRFSKDRRVDKNGRLISYIDNGDLLSVLSVMIRSKSLDRLPFRELLKLEYFQNNSSE